MIFEFRDERMTLLDVTVIQTNLLLDLSADTEENSITFNIFGNN